ncbi:MAG: DNA mismatch repair protein MutS [Vampirovibrionales bacterium]|nr:DNA mismatch repair protein MutS [Vampirovibrionales bacterium]
MGVLSETALPSAQDEAAVLAGFKPDLTALKAPQEYKSICSLTADLTIASPMMRQFLEIKQQYPGVLLLYRMGDFYETFFEDAITLSQALDITLTGRDSGGLGRVPMAGVPIKAIDPYLAKLLQQNFKVAICEQMEDPALAKGLVERRVVRVISSGTLSDSTLLPADRGNFLVAVWPEESHGRSSQCFGLGFGLAWSEISTGLFQVKTCPSLEVLLGDLSRLCPAELLVPGKWQRTEMGFPSSVSRLPADIMRAIARFTPCTTTAIADEALLREDAGEMALKKLLHVSTLAGYELDEHPLARRAAGLLGAYLKFMFVGEPPKLDSIQVEKSGDTLWMSATTRKALELGSSMKEGRVESSLWGVLNRTQTPMGARCLRGWLYQPLAGANSLGELTRRQQAIAALISSSNIRQSLSEAMASISDLERLSQRVANLTASPRDLSALDRSIQAASSIHKQLNAFPQDYLQALGALEDDILSVSDGLQAALLPEPAAQLKQGEVLREGFHAKLDEYRTFIRDQQAWLFRYEQELRETTGIKTLKILFNGAFGYMIEISRVAAQGLVVLPDGWQRKQTLTNAERYTSEALQRFESRLSEAQQQSSELEASLFIALRQSLLPAVPALKELSRRVAALDALMSLAQVAASKGYVQPTLTLDHQLDVVNGRHPVVENSLPMGAFVPNSCRLNSPANPQAPQLMLITGPNMAGKSTLMRQMALIVVMAQMGSFVPAEAATIGLADAIFTRIGAVDDLAAGQSTFMVEMTETAQILNNATAKSLVILDEIGRGTSTYDGVAIAWSVAEYLVSTIGCRTAFATHYHELNALEQAYPIRVQNWRMMVRDQGGEIEFLHMLAPGSAQKSYGIQVAKMAGIPNSVVHQASKRLASLHKRAATIEAHVNTLPEELAIDGMPQLRLF